MEMSNTKKYNWKDGDGVALYFYSQKPGSVVNENIPHGVTLLMSEEQRTLYLLREQSLFVNTELLQEWGWDDFKAVWETITVLYGEDAAWQTVYTIWQKRANKEIAHKGQLSVSDGGTPVQEWDWMDFKAMWNTITALEDEDEAWQTVYSIW